MSAHDFSLRGPDSSGLAFLTLECSRVSCEQTTLAKARARASVVPRSVQRCARGVASSVRQRREARRCDRRRSSSERGESVVSAGGWASGW